MVDKIDKFEEIEKRLKLRQGELLYTLIEDDSIYIPEILLSLIYELRSIRKTLDWLEYE